MQRANEFGRRLDRNDARAASDELTSQGTGAGADVEHELPLADPGEFREERCQPDRVPAHEVVVRLLIVVEDAAHGSIQAPGRFGGVRARLRCSPLTLRIALIVAANLTRR
jgi:hypothetical protein